MVSVMSVYMVVLEKPSKEVWSIIRKKWPNRQHYILDERIAFIAHTPSIVRGEIMLTGDLSDLLGMNEKKKVTGFVLEVPETIDGWHENTFWEWMEKVSA